VVTGRCVQDASTRTIRRRGRDERGTALVEGAIVIPLLFLILFAVIDFSWAFYQYISLRQGVREGAREAAITTIPGYASGWPTCSLATNNIPGGLPGTQVTAGVDFFDMMCYTKSRIGLGMGTNVRVSIAWSSGEAQNWAPTTNPSATDSLVICAQYKISSLTGALSPILNNYTITSKTEIRIEQQSASPYGDILNASPSLANSGPIAEQAFTSWPSSCTSA
jgi:Flp pilus assembly protein TadG